MERETGIEPATNGLGSRDSTTELLPLDVWLTITCKSIVRVAARDSGATPPRALDQSVECQVGAVLSWHGQQRLSDDLTVLALEIRRR